MNGKQKPRVTEVRPRGRQYQSISFSLTLEQIRYLDTQPNPSELIRRLLTQHMEQEQAPKTGDTLATLKSKLEKLEHEHSSLEREFWTWQDDHEAELYEGGREHYTEDDKPAFTKGAHADRLIRIYRNYEQRLEALNVTIKQVKEAISKAEH